MIDIAVTRRDHTSATYLHKIVPPRSSCLDPAMTAFYGLERRITRGGEIAMESGRARRNRIKRLVIIGGLGVALSACAGSEPPQVSGNRGMSCLDDSAHCVAQRQGALRHLVSRSDRQWVGEKASAHSYASGVRLYAFKTKKTDLSCAELQTGRREADGAAKVLRGPEGRSLTPAQVSRGIMFAEEVSRELGREHGRRCKRG